MSIWYSPINQAIRQELSINIVNKLARGNLSVVEELMGYSMAASQVEQAYAPRVAPEAGPRRIAAPEVLTGLVSSRKA